jgi:hypothetical protein
VYPAWSFLHAAVAVGILGALAGAAVLGARTRARAAAALALAAGALALVPVQVGLLLVLASYGPDFARQRLPLGLPLALLALTAAAALPALRRAGPGRPAALRVAVAAAALSVHLALVPPADVAGTGLLYADLLLGVALRPWLSRRAGAAGRPARPAGPGTASGPRPAPPRPAGPRRPTPCR